MPAPSENPLPLLAAADIRRAVELYVARAWPEGAPPPAQRFLPPADADTRDWLMGDVPERDPSDAPFDQVRSFALRIGNDQYPHMKLRLSRPPGESALVLSVDSHDAILSAPPGSPDAAALEELKRHNAEIASAVHAAWDAAGLLTERNYLRGKILQARSRQNDASAGGDQAGQT